MSLLDPQSSRRSLTTSSRPIPATDEDGGLVPMHLHRALQRYPPRPSMNPVHPDYRPDRSIPTKKHTKVVRDLLPTSPLPADPTPNALYERDERPSSPSARSNYSYSLYTLPASEVSVNRRWLDRMKGWAEDVGDDVALGSSGEEGSRRRAKSGGGDANRVGSFKSRVMSGEHPLGSSAKSPREPDSLAPPSRERSSNFRDDARVHSAPGSKDRGSKTSTRPAPNASLPTSGFAHDPTTRSPPPSSFARARGVRSDRGTNRQSTILPFESISSRPTPRATEVGLPSIESAREGKVKRESSPETGITQVKVGGTQEMKIGSMVFDVPMSDDEKSDMCKDRAEHRSKGRFPSEGSRQEDPPYRTNRLVGHAERTETADRIATRRLTAYRPDSPDPLHRLSDLSIVDDRTRRATAMNAGMSRAGEVQRNIAVDPPATMVRRQLSSSKKRLERFPSEIPADLKALPPIPASTTASWTSPGAYDPRSDEDSRTTTSIANLPPVVRRDVVCPADTYHTRPDDRGKVWERPRAGTPWNSRPGTMFASSSTRKSGREEGWEDVRSELTRHEMGPGGQRVSVATSSRRASRLEEANAAADTILTSVDQPRPRKRYPDRAASRVVSGTTFHTEATALEPKRSADPAPARMAMKKHQTRATLVSVSTKAQLHPAGRASVMQTQPADKANPASGRPEPEPNSTPGTNPPSSRNSGSFQKGKPDRDEVAPSTGLEPTTSADDTPSASLASRPSATPTSTTTMRPDTTRKDKPTANIIKAPSERRAGAIAIELKEETPSRAPAASRRSTLVDGVRLGGRSPAPSRSASRSGPRAGATLKANDESEKPERPLSSATWVTEPFSPVPLRSSRRSGSEPRGSEGTISPANNERLVTFRRNKYGPFLASGEAMYPRSNERRSDPSPIGYRSELGHTMQLPVPFGVNPVFPSAFHPPMMMPAGTQLPFLPNYQLPPRMAPTGFNPVIPMMGQGSLARQPMTQLAGRKLSIGAGFIPHRPGISIQTGPATPYFDGALNGRLSMPISRSSTRDPRAAALRVRSGMPQRYTQEPIRQQQPRRTVTPRRPRPAPRSPSGTGAIRSQRQVATAAAERALRKQDRALIRAARLRAMADQSGGTGGPAVAVNQSSAAPNAQSNETAQQGLLKRLFKR